MIIIIGMVIVIPVIIFDPDILVEDQGDTLLGGILITYNLWWIGIFLHLEGFSLHFETGMICQTAADSHRQSIFFKFPTDSDIGLIIMIQAYYLIDTILLTIHLQFEFIFHIIQIGHRLTEDHFNSILADDFDTFDFRDLSVQKFDILIGQFFPGEIFIDNQGGFTLIIY